MLAKTKKAERERVAELGALAKELTGMDSWQEYASKEASYLAWNDIQQHGHFTDIRHDELSDVSPNSPMKPCADCQRDIMSKLQKRQEKQT